MKKFLKILAVAAIAVAAAIACAFVGCNDGGSSETKSDYNFTIVYKGGDKDGKPVNGKKDGKLAGGKVATQFCVGSDCRPLADRDMYLSSNGTLYVSQAKVNEIFESQTDVTVFDFKAFVKVGDETHTCEINVNGPNDYTYEIVLG